MGTGAASRGLLLVIVRARGRSNLMRVSRDGFAEFILSAAEGLAMTLGRAERGWESHRAAAKVGAG